MWKSIFWPVFGVRNPNAGQNIQQTCINNYIGQSLYPQVENCKKYILTWSSLSFGLSSMTNQTSIPSLSPGVVDNWNQKIRIFYDDQSNKIWNEMKWNRLFSWVTLVTFINENVMHVTEGRLHNRGSWSALSYDAYSHC